MSCPILCVEDDPDIGRLLTSILIQAGHQPTWISTGEEALHRWRDASLVVLDLMLPGIDGLAVCRDIRAHDATIPIIMLTALAGTRDVVVGLEIGADDYITKPFDTDILLARIQALLRRRKAMEERTSSTLLKIKALEIDIDGYSVKFDGKMIQLTTREFALLVFFARHPGKGFSRSELLDTVWGPEFDGFDHTVNTHINRLRSKIEPDPARPEYILTVWGTGYRFTDAAVAPASASGENAP